MEISLSLLKIMNVHTIFGPYHTHCLSLLILLYHTSLGFIDLTCTSFVQHKALYLDDIPMMQLVNVWSKSNTSLFKLMETLLLQIHISFLPCSLILGESMFVSNSLQPNNHHVSVPTNLIISLQMIWHCHKTTQSLSGPQKYGKACH